MRLSHNPHVSTWADVELDLYKMGSLVFLSSQGCGVLAFCQDDRWLIPAHPHVTSLQQKGFSCREDFFIYWKSHFFWQHNSILSVS